MMKVSRIGLINFWLYDDEEFDFYDGKLLLRGSNGSGKSVTMQSFIPVILDGDKRPIRLDPFGTSDKHMEDYLLGGQDSQKKEEATGYLYMEVYDDEKDKYITVGMGLHARIGRPVDFWGFLLQDGRRIGKDFLLYHSKTEKVPFSKKELQAALGTENILVDNAREYKKMVNNVLFGFRSLESYDEFINVLLQLRSPKLSKEYKPTKLMNILTSVLNPLNEEDLRPLSEAIEDMDNTKEKIERFTSDAKQVSNLLKTLNNYNETLLYKKAVNYHEQEEALKDSSKNLNNLIENISKSESDINRIEEELKNLDIEYARLIAQKENLDSKGLETRVNRLDFLKTSLEEIDHKKTKKELELENKKSKEKMLEQEIKERDNKAYLISKEGYALLKDVQVLSESVKFDETYQALKDLNKDFHTSISFENIEVRLKHYQEKLKGIYDQLLEKETIESDINKLSEEISSIEKEVSLINEKINEVEEQLTTALRDVKDQILYLQKHNQLIKFDEDTKNEMFKYLQKYDEKDYLKAKEIYLALSEKYQTNKLEEIYSLKNKLDREISLKEELEREWNDLRKSDEEELEMALESPKTIQYLKDENICYTHLYKVIDFKENIDDKTKNALEYIMMQSGLLYAFVVSKKDLPKVVNQAGLFLRSTFKKPKNLSQYFMPVSNDTLEEQEILDILESISIDEKDDIYLNEKKMGFDVFFGYSTQEWTSKYIGLLTRQERRLARIKEKEDEIKNKESIIRQLNQKIELKKEEQNLILEEKDNFPSSNTLNYQTKELAKYNYSLEMLITNRNQKEEQMKPFKIKLENILEALIHAKKDVLLPLTKDAFKNALEDVSELLVCLTKLKSLIKDYENQEEMKLSHKMSLEDLAASMDDLQIEIGDYQTNKQKFSKELTDLENLLHTDEYHNLAALLEEITNGLKRIPKEKESLQKSLGALLVTLENLHKEKSETELKNEEMKDLLTLKEEFLKEEYDLHYVMNKDFENTSLMAKEIMKTLSSRKDTEITNVTNNYYQAYNEYRLSLNNYHLTSVTLFEKDIMDDYKNLRKENERFDIEAVYQGKKLKLNSLIDVLKIAIEENNTLLSAQDQNLFEEILLKTIGLKIKMRIIESKEWVKNINQIMHEMQKDSALSFNLEWRSKDASDMNEVDTRELVRLFNMDNEQRGDENQKLIKHFRNRLAKELDDSNGTESYADVIFRVLDYRSWFEFKMTYQRVGENKKDLTDKVFSVFSGGEKAKTMYIPLFAAVSSKLSSANKNALRLVALDEAFAGVDDINIKEMFGILDHLNLDYILTSQALWGDYATIKDLAIAELIRPNNAPFVTVQRYRWNGKSKEIIEKKEILNDSIKLF